MRRGTIFVTLIAFFIGACLFQLKYEVMSLEGQYKNICHEIQKSDQSISILKAEWAHLTNPQRLQQLAQKHLSVYPLTQKQIVAFRGQVSSPMLQNVASSESIQRGKGSQLQNVHHVVEEPISAPKPLVSQSKVNPVVEKDDIDQIIQDLEKETVDAPKTVVKKTDSHQDPLESLMDELIHEGKSPKTARRR